MKIPMEEKLRKGAQGIGGKPGKGSGFEEEVAEPELSDPEPADKAADP